MPKRRAIVMHWPLALCALAGCRTADPTAVDAYRQSFATAVGSTFTQSLTRTELLRTMRGTRVLWLGDHHRSARLHGLQLELLQQLHDAGVPLVLALEAIGEQDEGDVAAFLRGDVEMAELRTRLRRRWSGSWLDDRELDPWHYQSLLAFARRARAPVHAIEPTPRLPMAHRDPHIATTVLTIAHEHQGKLVVVVVGQAHLVGDGDLVARTGLPNLAFGGEPPPSLREHAPDARARGTVHASGGGLWWFSELL